MHVEAETKPSQRANEPRRKQIVYALIAELNSDYVGGKTWLENRHKRGLVGCQCASSLAERVFNNHLRKTNTGDSHCETMTEVAINTHKHWKSNGSQIMP